jgi:hypothetical protein
MASAGPSTGLITSIGTATGVPVAVLLYRIDGSKLTVLNETVELEARVIDSFCRAAFDRHPAAGTVRLHAIHLKGLLCLPSLAFPYSEDIAMPLPSTVAEYRAGLGKATAKNLGRHYRQVLREHSSFEQIVLRKEAIPDDLVREIVRLNSDRMREKGRIPLGDETQLRQRLELAQHYGVLGAFKAGGTMAAGALALHVGDAFYLE